jgi:hypothetical protein
MVLVSDGLFGAVQDYIDYALFVMSVNCFLIGLAPAAALFSPRLVNRTVFSPLILCFPQLVAAAFALQVFNVFQLVFLMQIAVPFSTSWLHLIRLCPVTSGQKIAC